VPGARQVGKTTAARAAFLAPRAWKDQWSRGGFPDALQGDSRRWWDTYLRLELERDLPPHGVRADPIFMRRLLTMLAHQQGGLLNASALGSSLGVLHHTLLRHLDVLKGIHLVRRLPPTFRNLGKRLTQSPKVYLRDAMTDLQAARGWIVDQAEGIARIGANIARAGFDAVQIGCP